MYCTACGNAMNDADRFCAHCGKASGAPSAPADYAPRPRMRRYMAEKKIAGVCAGIARHMAWDVTLVRVAFLAAILFKGLGLIAYLIAWIAMPRDDEPAFNPAQAAPPRP
jgi:phage shock protein C